LRAERRPSVPETPWRALLVKSTEARSRRLWWSANRPVAGCGRVPRISYGPWLVVGAAVVWNLGSLQAETLGVSYLDDSSVHEQMVRFAAQQFGAGHLALTSWFPFLGLGSPQFLHYQSLPAMLTALLGLAVSPNTAFRWSMYLLLSLWPISVYLAARLFGAGRPAAAASAAMSPFLVSVTGIGYEQHAYLWVGFGVWTQLWASLTLPLAWGLSWRVIRDGRGFVIAVMLISLTIALHFETGYLALIPLLGWPLVAGTPIAKRVLRAGALAVGSLLACAWVIVPLIEQRAWTSTNEVLHGTGLANGYGVGRVLSWLISGQLLDDGRVPVVTLFAGIGLTLACVRCRKDANARALLVVLAASLLLSSGRTTFGALVDVIPGARDIFFRRFMMAIQLAALVLAGGGAAWCLRAISNVLVRATAFRGLRRPRARARNELARATIALAGASLVLAPAWLQLGSYDRHNTAAIDAQRHADASEGAQVDRLIALIEDDGGGRVYAGMPSNWGVDFTVGAVPVFKYLESRNVDEVGYTLRTASLMTDPEYYFDERNLGDYQLFGIHYLILPSGQPPPVAARFVLREGPYSLWTLGAVGYVRVGRIVGLFAANRMNVGVRSIALLHSRLAQRGDYLLVTFGQKVGAVRPLPSKPIEAYAGTVTAESDDLDLGQVAVTVRMRQRGVVVLSASFDPGWTAMVDGHQRRTEMIAPALVAITVGPGTHRIAFRYRGFSGYPVLFVIGGLALAALLGVDMRCRRRARPAAKMYSHEAREQSR
jgi:hypothetical protein